MVRLKLWRYLSFFMMSDKIGVAEEFFFFRDVQITHLFPIMLQFKSEERASLQKRHIFEYLLNIS